MYPTIQLSNSLMVFCEYQERSALLTHQLCLLPTTPNLRGHKSRLGSLAKKTCSPGRRLCCLGSTKTRLFSRVVGLITALAGAQRCPEVSQQGHPPRSGGDNLRTAISGRRRVHEKKLGRRWLSTGVRAAAIFSRALALSLSVIICVVIFIFVSAVVLGMVSVACRPYLRWGPNNPAAVRVVKNGFSLREPIRERQFVVLLLHGNKAGI